MEKRGLLAILLAVTVLGTAFGNPGIKLTFTNNTGYTIKELYVSPTSHDDWYENLLKEGEVPNGKSVEVMIPEYESDELVFDIMAVDTEGDSYSKYEVDLTSPQNRVVEFTFDAYEESSDSQGNMSGNTYNSGYMDGYRDAFRDAYSEAYKEGFKAGMEAKGNN